MSSKHPTSLDAAVKKKKLFEGKFCARKVRSYPKILNELGLARYCISKSDAQ